MTDTATLEMPVRMSVRFERLGDREKVQRLVECIMHHDPTLKNDAWLLGVGKMFYDIGAGIDIWDTSDIPETQHADEETFETSDADNGL